MGIELQCVVQEGVDFEHRRLFVVLLLPAIQMVVSTSSIRPRVNM